MSQPDDGYAAVGMPQELVSISEDDVAFLTFDGMSFL